MKQERIFQHTAYSFPFLLFLHYTTSLTSPFVYIVFFPLPFIPLTPSSTSAPPTPTRNNHPSFLKGALEINASTSLFLGGRQLKWG